MDKCLQCDSELDDCTAAIKASPHVHRMCVAAICHCYEGRLTTPRSRSLDCILAFELVFQFSYFLKHPVSLMLPRFANYFAYSVSTSWVLQLEPLKCNSKKVETIPRHVIATEDFWLFHVRVLGLHSCCSVLHFFPILFLHPVLFMVTRFAILPILFNILCSLCHLVQQFSPVLLQHPALFMLTGFAFLPILFQRPMFFTQLESLRCDWKKIEKNAEID